MSQGVNERGGGRGVYIGSRGKVRPPPDGPSPRQPPPPALGRGKGGKGRPPSGLQPSRPPLEASSPFPTWGFGGKPYWAQVGPIPLRLYLII